MGWVYASVIMFTVIDVLSSQTSVNFSVAYLVALRIVMTEVAPVLLVPLLVLPATPTRSVRGIPSGVCQQFSDFLLCVCGAF